MKFLIFRVKLKIKSLIIRVKLTMKSLIIRVNYQWNHWSSEWFKWSIINF